MSEEQKKQLEKQLWNIADTLRGKMHADEFRDYILGFIFYKYLSEKMLIKANALLKTEGISYTEIDEISDEGKEMLKAIREDSIQDIGYFLKPSELFSVMAKRGNSKSDDIRSNTEYGGSNFILGDLAKVLSNIQNSTMGTDSEDDFEDLFSDLDLTSQKLGKTEAQKNELISKVLGHLDKIDFQLSNAEADVLGDAYEYLIAQFASGAGKKAGEFYTPQEVSKVLAKIVTTGKKQIKTAYDPTCGSGSLLLRIAKEAEVGEFFGQELNRTTYNLARMNMILHGVHYSRFNIKQEDTLEHPQHMDGRFEAIVANPPFSAHWKANPLKMTDDRFSQYGKLAPATKADFAFVQHMIHHLDENGTMAVVLPHGTLSRGGTERQIRKFLVEDRNYLDAVIGLPTNLFYGTEIPACIMVFKKCRENPDNIFYIDASADFERGINQNFLRSQDVERIASIYASRSEIEQYSTLVPVNKIKDNDYNLNISRYIRPSNEGDVFDLGMIARLLDESLSDLKIIDSKIALLCQELDIPTPKGTNLLLLKSYKKSLLYKIFTKEIRFKDENGVSFQDWKTMRLSDVSERVLEKNKKGEIKLVLTNSAVNGIVRQGDYFDKEIANENNLGGYYVVRKNDFVYNPRISISAPVGPIKRSHIDLGIMSPLYSVFRFLKGNNDFYEQYFETTLWHGYMRSVANFGARHDRMNIVMADFHNMPLPFPDLKEQERISELLMAIDKKIECIGRTDFVDLAE